MIIGAVCMRYLRLVQLYYSREQIQEIIGKNFGPKIDKFLEAKIAPEALDIDIQVGLGFDESPAAKVEKVTALVQNKIFTPLEAKKAMRDYGNIDALIENTFLDEAQAERNLDRVLAGQPADISLWANHMAHMKVFTDFVKTPEWEELDPEIKKKIDGYIETLMGHMQAQQAMQTNPGAEQGTGKGTGQPGPPPQPPNLMAQNQAEGNLHLAQGQPTAPGPNIGV